MKNQISSNLQKENEELKKEIKKLKSRKKYGLVWEEKPEQVIELCKDKLPVLTEEESKEIRTDKDKQMNVLIEGDNYQSLSVLNYTHNKNVDIIYIDPPYNTGNNDFIYNDRFVDREDSFRHSKWLSFIEKRLKLAKNLLKDNGLIFISIDDNEQSPLKMLCDEIFNESNFVANLVWENKEGGGKSDSNFFRIKHEYILVYAKDIKKAKIFGLPVEDEERYKLSDKHLSTRGKYQLIKLDSASLGYVKSLDYPIEAPNGKPIYPNKDSKKISRWRWGKEKLIWGIKNDFVVIKQDKNDDWAVYTKQYLNCDNEGNLLDRLIQPIGVISKYSTTQSNRLLKDFFGEAIFNYSKPIELIEYLLKISTSNNSTILDFMAGSGTTGQAVLELNKEDGGTRKFILCTNNENNICEKVCYPRIIKAINGYKNLKGEKIAGLGGNLKYFKTDFVEAKQTDKNKKKLVDKSTEMLCLKEDCFDVVKKGQNFKIFTNNQGKNLGIIYDDTGIEPFKKEVQKLNKKVNTYIFSLDDSAREEEFEDIKKLVDLKPIPAVILNVYKRIFK